MAIIIPYCPTPLWRKTIHPNLESHRFSVIVAHRRFGKTVGTVNHMIKMAVRNDERAPRYAYVAPYRNQAKEIAWEYLKYYTHVIPGLKKPNETDLYIELPTKHKGSPGARIYIIGADKPDNLRGTYWDGCILDEYAQIKPELYDEVVRPAIADRKGWLVFVGTPKGQNQFYEVYKKSLQNKSWYSCMFRADESGVFAPGGRIGPEELEEMKKEMSDVSIRQELYCDFKASASNVLITIDLVDKAVSKAINSQDIAGAPRVMGVDVARFGDDRSCIFKREGLAAYEPIVYKCMDNMTLASNVIRQINEFHPDAVFVDSGRGEGVIDRCRQLGYDVLETNFSKRLKGRYLNKRMEMYDNLRKWLEAGGSLPDNSQLKAELTIPEYSFNAAGQMQLESKDDIKKKLGKSPDIADALALTFAEPVLPQRLESMLPNSGMSNTEYNPLDF